MSYIEQLSSNLPNFGKAVISVWFRVPHTSIESAAASNGIIPIVTFGKILSAFHTRNDLATSSYSYTENVYSTAFTCDLLLQYTSTKTIDLPLTSRDADYNLDQCYIGLDCSQQFDDIGNPLPAQAHLRVSLQTQNEAIKSGIVWEQISGSSGTVNAYEGIPTVPGGCGDLVEIDGAFVIAGAVTSEKVDYGDIRSLVYNQFESFAATSPTIVVSADKWHHVLLSFDISGEISATGNFNGAANSLSSACKMWLAFDNVNYTGDDLPRIPNPFGGPLGPNDIITSAASDAFVATVSTPTEQTGIGSAGHTAQTSYQYDRTFTGLDSPPFYDLSGASIALAGQPIGLPSVSGNVSNVHHIELAEFQMFTGVTLDTSVIANRRAFINYRLDSNGHQLPGANFLQSVDPTRATPGALPGSPPPGVTATGKKPDVLFHGSRNWIAGKNTGALGVLPNGNPNPAGQFHPTGKIKKYKPDPGLPPAPQGTPQ